MKRTWGWVAAAGLCLGLGCRRGKPPVAEREGPMPANTVLLSTMMEELSARPGFTEALLAHLDHGAKEGAALLTPELVDRMRGMIVGKDWKGLDRFPGMTMREVNPAIHVVGHVAGRVAGGMEAGAPQGMKAYVDFGPYALESGVTEDFRQASGRGDFASEGLQGELGAGVVRGDGPNPALAARHAESRRLAEVLNRLSLNGVAGVAAMTVTLDLPAVDEEKTLGERMVEGDAAAPPAIRTPEDFVQGLIASGHTVVVSDARYFANFGHLHYKGEEVIAPFWINSEIRVPGTNRPLLVPVSHAEYEWMVRGPRVNGDVAFYFGIDGKAHFRTMDEQDQAWVLGRHAHEYRGEEAVEVTRLVGKLLVAYVHQHQKRPGLPFGGYYALGVCQDGVSAIEKKMTGTVTLFPNTADMTLFDVPEDAEINQLLGLIPKDRAGKKPEVERIFGSLPTEDLEAITIPGLKEDLTAVDQAWKDGSLDPAAEWGRRLLWVLAVAAAAAVLYGLSVVVKDQMPPRVDM